MTSQHSIDTFTEPHKHPQTNTYTCKVSDTNKQRQCLITWKMLASKNMIITSETEWEGVFIVLPVSLVYRISSNLNPHDNYRSNKKNQSWWFMSRLTSKIILGQVLSIATCGTQTHRGDSLWLDAKLANLQASEDLSVIYHIQNSESWTASIP